MSWWESLVKAVQLRPRHLFGVALAGLVVALLPDSVSDRLGMRAILSVARGWISLAGILSFCLGLVQLFPSLVERWRARKSRAAVLAGLDSLSREEELLLAYCVSRNRRTLLLRISGTQACVATGLCYKGLMQRAGGTHPIYAWPYLVPAFVWDAIVLRYADFTDPHSPVAVEHEPFFHRLDISASGRGH